MMLKKHIIIQDFAALKKTWTFWNVVFQPHSFSEAIFTDADCVLLI